MHGFTNLSIQQILQDKRVLLAPVRFGAGIKGKIVDSWTYGTPVVTTPIGSEGMHIHSEGRDTDDDWGGVVAKDSQSFVEGAVRLYTNPQQWHKAQQRGTEIVAKLYNIRPHWDSVLEQLVDVCNNLESRRRNDYTRSILWQQSNRSTEYFSKWLELKSKIKYRHNQEVKREHAKNQI